MSKNSQRTAWMYVIIALLIANLFVINNYITGKAVKIIKTKNDVNYSSISNLVKFKDGVVQQYYKVANGAKKIVGINTDIAELNASSTNATISSQVPLNDHNFTDLNLSNKVVLKKKKPGKSSNESQKNSVKQSTKSGETNPLTKRTVL